MRLKARAIPCFDGGTLYLIKGSGYQLREWGGLAGCVISIVVSRSGYGRRLVSIDGSNVRR